MTDSPAIPVISAVGFPLGKIVATPNALEQVSKEEMQVALNRHVARDWGNLDEEDRRANNEALHEGLRLLSSYQTTTGVNFWIITEWDRSATTILLPEDY